MQIFGYTIIKTSKFVDLTRKLEKLNSMLEQAMKNDYRDEDGKYTKGP